MFGFFSGLVIGYFCGRSSVQINEMFGEDYAAKARDRRMTEYLADIAKLMNADELVSEAARLRKEASRLRHESKRARSTYQNECDIPHFTKCGECTMCGEQGIECKCYHDSGDLVD